MVFYSGVQPGKSFGIWHSPWLLLIAVLMLTVFLDRSASASAILGDATLDDHPIGNAVLDLSVFDTAQYRRILIDGGTTLKLLTPTSGAPARLVAIEDIVLNGAIDAGIGALILQAGNISLANGVRVSAGSILLESGQAYNEFLAVGSRQDSFEAIWWYSGFILTQVAVLPEIPATAAIYEAVSVEFQPPATVPEPATDLLMFAGLLMLLWHFRGAVRRTKNNV